MLIADHDAFWDYADRRYGVQMLLACSKAPPARAANEGFKPCPAPNRALPCFLPSAENGIGSGQNSTDLLITDDSDQARGRWNKR
jgi:hypothetical protein